MLCKTKRVVFVLTLLLLSFSESIANIKSSLDTYLYDYDGLCNKKQVGS